MLKACLQKGRINQKGTYTESISTGPKLIQICYINPVPSSTGGVNRATLLTD